MELFDVIDSKGNPTGQIVSREKAHAEGIPHRTAHIRIPFRENLILLQPDIFRQEMNHWNLHFGN